MAKPLQFSWPALMVRDLPSLVSALNRRMGLLVQVLTFPNGMYVAGPYLLGDTLYADTANSLLRLPGNVTTTKQYLSQTGTGTVSAAPVWATLSPADFTGSIAYSQLPTGAGIWTNTGLTLSSTLIVGPTTGWTAMEKASFVDTAYNFFGARNVGLLGITQTNYFQYLGHDDNSAVPNIVTLYAACTDNHATGTRTSSVGFEGDLFHTGAGTSTGEAGVIGFHQTSAGVVTSQLAVEGSVKVTGGTVTDSAGIYGIVSQSGGTVTNSYAGFFPGPSRTAGTVANNYGVYIGRVGTAGTTTNYPLYVAVLGGAVTITDGGTVSLPNVLTVTGLITANSGLTVASGQTLTLTAAIITGAPTWNSNQAITLSTAAQPNVTSLGTLSSLNVGGDAKITTVGNGFYVKEGVNATMGTATLVGGTVVVSTTKVTGSSRIFLTNQSGTTNAGELTVSARTAGTSFTITSVNAADANTVAWLIVEPA